MMIDFPLHRVNPQLQHQSLRTPRHQQDQDVQKEQPSHPLHLHLSLHSRPCALSQRRPAGHLQSPHWTLVVHCAQVCEVSPNILTRWWRLIFQTATCAQVFWDPSGGGRPVQHRPRPARSSGGTRAGKRSLCRTWGWTCQRLPRAGTRAKNQEPAESRAGTWGGKFEKSSRAGTRSPGQSGTRARAEEPKIPFGVSSGTGAWRKLPWAWTRAWKLSKGENFEGKSGSSTRGNVERPKQQSLLYRLLNVFCYSLCTYVQLGPNVQRGINVEMTTTCKLCFLWVDKWIALRLCFS